MLPYYYSANEYILNTFGHKLYKISLNAGMTCPNRDGSLGTKGCIFCSAKGSGDFTAAGDSITEQLTAGAARLSTKYKGCGYIAYFQAFTNTYAPIETLRRIYTEAITHPSVEALSIATRPDCLDSSITDLLAEFNRIKPVWVELGFQTSKPQTATYIRRGFDNAVYAQAVQQLRMHQSCSHIITHMIIGLPGETPEDMKRTIRFITDCGSDGVKLQLLHILKDTDLAADYARSPFPVLTQEQYIRIVAELLQLLPKDMVIHRITGDGPKKTLIAPLWSADKKTVLNTMHRYFKEQNILQGSKLKNHSDEMIF